MINGLKWWLLFFALLVLPRVAIAQSTTVSGNVSDTPDAQTWNNGTFIASFTPNQNYPSFSSYTWSGGTLSQTFSGTLTGTGTYSVSIPSSTAITPQGSSWSFKFCPQATALCFNIGNITITGATQTVNATPPSIRINWQNPPSTVTAYSDTEVSTGANIGNSYFNLTSAAVRVCNTVSGNSCTVWAAAGGGGGGTVITTGTPANGNLAKFSGATSITNGDLSGDATTSGALAVTVGKINGTSLAGLATGILKNTTGTGVPSIAVAGDFPTLNQNTTGTSAGLSLPSGTATMGTTAIASGACTTVVTAAAANLTTATGVFNVSFNGDPTAVTGYGASATGAVLTIYPYPTAGNVNFKVCNNTASSITPSALTLNWQVTHL